MKRKIITPAALVIESLGGVRAAARKLGRSPSSISKWQSHNSTHGLGGRIPAKMRLKILKVLEKEGADVTSRDLDFGRVVAK